MFELIAALDNPRHRSVYRKRIGLAGPDDLKRITVSMGGASDSSASWFVLAASRRELSAANQLALIQTDVFQVRKLASRFRHHHAGGGIEGEGHLASCCVGDISVRVCDQ